MADTKTAEIQLSELRAKAEAAERKTAEVEAMLSAERERNKAVERKAVAVSARARFDKAVTDKLTVPAFRAFWCGEHAEDGTPVMVTASDGKTEVPKNFGWAVAHPEMFEQFLALCSPAQSPGAPVTGSSDTGAPVQVTAATIDAEYNAALQAQIEITASEQPHLRGAALTSEARMRVAQSNPQLHARYRATVPGRVAQ